MPTPSRPVTAAWAYGWKPARKSRRSSPTRTTSVIALNFPAFTDGRHCSSAYLLRNRYGYKGELRAIGDVLRDQLFSYQRVGFDAFALRADKDPVDALKAFEEFSEVYQASTDQPLPLFRRRA